MTVLSNPVQTPDPVPEVFNYAGAAKVLGRSVTWLQRQVRYGTVPYRRLPGGGVSFTREDLNNIIAGAYRAPGSDTAAGNGSAA